MWIPSLATMAAMLFLATGEEPENPWKEKVETAVRHAEADPTTAALRAALDTCWRADDWAAGMRLAERVREKHPDDGELRGLAARALWRGGRLADAERLAERLPLRTADTVGCRLQIAIHLSRGEQAEAEEWAQRLERLGPKTADDYYHVFAVRFSAGKLAGLADLVRKAERLASPKNGYPETCLPESIEGVAAFLDAVGPQPLNQIAQYGAAPLTPLGLFNLPACDVLIDGHGPSRMVVDTGGSIMVALDQTLADELGLKSVAQASVRGVSGKQATGQVVVDELRIGTIVARRVMTRTFDVRGAIMNAADGIIGTGIFAQGRMTLDWAGGQLLISRSRDEAGAGTAAELRLVGDAKLIVPALLEGGPAVSLLDTGADVVALAPSCLRRLFPDHEVRTFNAGVGVGVGAGQQTEISLGSGARLVLAGRTFENYGGLGLDALDKTLSPLLGVQIDALLGMPMFRQMKSATVDFPKCKMWVEWLER